MTLAANEDYSGGRPFVDSIEIQMGRNSRMTVCWISNSTRLTSPKFRPRKRGMRRRRGVRSAHREPDELVALAFWPGARSRKTRASAKLSLDRLTARDCEFHLAEGRRAGRRAAAAMVERHGVSVFDGRRSCRREGISGRKSLGSPKIVLGYDSDDSLEQSIAERIAVNAREAGIVLDAGGECAWPAPSRARLDDVRLVRLRMPSPRPREALAQFSRRVSVR